MSVLVKVVGQLIQDCVSKELEANNVVNTSQRVLCKVGFVKET